jgi:2-oxoglutarate ferredoxin oxidoreductase subunit delta
MTEVMPAGNETPATEEKLVKTKRGPRGEVVIFGKWCKGCGLCVEFCPTGVLGYKGKDIPEVLHPEKCTACHWCDTHCPDLAIIVKSISS